MHQNDNNSNKSASEPSRKKQINLMTFNIACLPLAGAINAKFLRPNHLRSKMISERINEWNKTNENNAPDIICFQEAFAIETRVLLKQQLTNYYPHNTEKLGQRVRSSGLYLFSKYPIVEAHYKQFKNIIVGNERLAIKGFIGAKLQIDDEHFITIYTTHLEAGGAIAKEKQIERYGATISWKRGEQMGLIYHDMQTWSTTPPKSNPLLVHEKTFLLGDLNVGLNDERRMYSLSTGKSENGYKKGMKKYPGQYDLFTLLEHSVPNNFIETREESKLAKGPKIQVKEYIERAKKENRFLGTAIPDEISIRNKEQNTPLLPYETKPKVIDGCLSSKHTRPNNSDSTPEFETKIISFKLNGEVGESDISLSDHFPVLGTWRPALFSPVNAFESKPETINDSVSRCVIV